MMIWKIYHLCKMEDGYTVYDNDDDDDKWYMLCLSLLTPIIIISVIYDYS